jgi:hypothetical protein
LNVPLIHIYDYCFLALFYISSFIQSLHIVLGLPLVVNSSLFFKLSVQFKIIIFWNIMLCSSVTFQRNLLSLSSTLQNVVPINQTGQHHVPERVTFILMNVRT